MKFFALRSAALLLALSYSAAAQQITYDCQGTITSVSSVTPPPSGFLGGIQVGQAFSLTLVVNAHGPANAFSNIGGSFGSAGYFGGTVLSSSFTVGGVSGGPLLPFGDSLYMTDDETVGTFCTDSIEIGLDAADYFMDVSFSNTTTLPACPSTSYGEALPLSIDISEWFAGFWIPLSPYAGISGAITQVTSTVTDGLYSTFCQGDGANAMGCLACPCGNDAPPGARGGCLNSVGTSARLEADGEARVSNDRLGFRMYDASPNTFAILASGAQAAPANPANPCFGLNTGLVSNVLDGLRCAVQDVRRHGTRATSVYGVVGIATNGWGLFFAPAGGLVQNGGFVAGQTRYFQAYYREDVAFVCGTGQNTTQAVEVTILP